jgi:putative flavoprotein involved in K+ transport
MFALADLKLNRLLDTFDAWATREREGEDLGAPERFEPTRAPESSRVRIDLGSGEIRTILWATGFRPDYSWLHVPVVDAKGNVRHDGGVVVDSPGMVVLGLPVLRRRRSSFINGAEGDARALVDHLAGYLERQARPASRQ